MPSSTALQAYFEQEARRPASWRGQLDPGFQAALAAHHRDVARADCDFLHAATLRSGEVIGGRWDFRGCEPACLGHQNFRGKRVLEYWPANGGLSRHISEVGAFLVTFDLPFGAAPEPVPDPGRDAPGDAAVGETTRLRNGWWLSRRDWDWDASAVHGDIYAPPADLGRFDVAVFCLVLPRLADPFRALRRAAAMTTGTIIVTQCGDGPDFVRQIDAYRQSIPTLMVFDPRPPAPQAGVWWALSPDIVSRMLRLLGFSEISVTWHRLGDVAGAPELFTLVAHRPAAGP